jgi:hypothetical protein
MGGRQSGQILPIVVYAAEQISAMNAAVPSAVANLDGQFKGGQVGSSSAPLGHQFIGGQMTYTLVGHAKRKE